MNSKVAILAVIALSVGLIGNAYAHKAQVVGDYNVEVGWKIEPPISGKKNAIEITITQVSSSDKQNTKENHMDHDSASAKSTDSKSVKETKEPKPEGKTTAKHVHAKKAIGVTGLSKTIEADVTLNGKKTFLKLVEDKKNKGTYHGAFTPGAEGHPLVHVVGKIKKTPIELTFHPEKVEPFTKK